MIRILFGNLLYWYSNASIRVWIGLELRLESLNFKLWILLLLTSSCNGLQAIQLNDCQSRTCKLELLDWMLRFVIAFGMEIFWRFSWREQNIRLLRRLNLQMYDCLSMIISVNLDYPFDFRSHSTRMIRGTLDDLYMVFFDDLCTGQSLLHDTTCIYSTVSIFFLFAFHWIDFRLKSLND